MPTAPGPYANTVCVGGFRAGGVIACDDGGVGRLESLECRCDAHTHSVIPASGPRKYECICGVDKAGIGSIKFISRITDKSKKHTTLKYSPNKIINNNPSPIPACAGMTRVVCVWALTLLCHREGVKRPWRSSK